MSEVGSNGDHEHMRLHDTHRKAVHPTHVCIFHPHSFHPNMTSVNVLYYELLPNLPLLYPAVSRCYPFALGGDVASKAVHDRQGSFGV